MEKQKIKTDLGTLAITLVMASILFTGNSYEISRATEPAASTNAEADKAVYENEQVCKYEIRAYIEAELPKFRDFIDQHFQNKSSTKSLLDIAFAKYGEFRQKLINKLSLYYPPAGSNVVMVGSAPSECFSLVQQAESDAQSFIVRKVEVTSSVKKVTAIMDKYKQINQKLALLNQTFLNVKNLMDKFAKKLPCYIKDCNSG